MYPAYLAIRGLTIGDPDQALTHATRLIDLERTLDLFHETALQQLVGSAVGFLSVYYMVGFAPLLVTVLGWLAIRHRAHYRDLRSLLFIDSIAGATAALAALTLVALYRLNRSIASGARRPSDSFQVVSSLPQARNEPAAA